MGRSAEELGATLREADISRVHVVHHTLSGALAWALCSADAFRRATLSPQPSAWAAPDAHVRADWDSHWRMGGATWCLGTLHPDGGSEVHPQCTRGLLRRLVDRAGELGARPLVAVEQQFRLLSAEGLVATAPAHGALDALGEALRAADVALDALQPAEEPGLFTLVLPPAPAALASDLALRARLVLRHTGLPHGLRTSVMARVRGSSLRATTAFTLSHWNNDLSVNQGVDADGRLSGTGEQVAAGITEHLGAMATLLCPNTTSTPWHPVELDVPSVSLPLPSGAQAVSAWHGVRVAVAASDVAPHLGVAALLGMALHGLEHRAELPPASVLRDRTFTGRQLDLPLSQEDALGRLRMSTHARSMLGGALVDAVVAARREALERVRRTVTDVETTAQRDLT